MTEELLDEDMLRDLQKRTAQLPREIAPPEDAWARIKAQIDMESALRLASPVSRERAFWQRPAFLVAAVLLLVAGTSLSTALVIGRGAIANNSRTVTAESPGAYATSRSTSGGPASLAEFTVIENDYIGTANRLSAVIEGGETELTSETIAKLRASLRVIDAAILEARRALAADPANKALIEMLSTSYSQKVDLLRRTAEMGQS